MTLLSRTCSSILPPDAAAAERAQALLDGKTKPHRSLGRLEELACRIAAARRDPSPEPLRKAVVIMAADHGVAEEGVSAFPQEVTRQMVLNFASGGAAINVLARQVGAEVVIADLGVREPLPELPSVRSRRIGPGTRNFTRGPAMRREEAEAALEAGIAIAGDLAGAGATLLGAGEMGIANTTSASALAAVFTGASPVEITGRGTGIGDEALRRKVAVVERALALHRPDPRDPVGTLAQIGGFEIAGLAGLVLGSAARSVPVVIDGFISSTAALAAVRLAPACAGYLVASHRSAEPGHGKVLEALGARPLLDLGMRLGEGTGAALAMGLADSALRILREMSTFETAGVSGRGAD